ncbi:hypothetical protein [Lignipirellula cremea]|nr:hypothetical protein [Lignipirellula cremea]
MAEEPATPSSSATAEQLVEQLGDASYDQRERARQQLLDIGLAARAALDGGRQHPDPEIALRCRRLWDEVRILSGWQEVRSVVGSSPKARALYDKMYLADTAFWYELAESPRPRDRLFPDRQEQLQQTLKESPTPTWVIEGALANAFYFGLLAKQAKPELELESLDELLRVGRCQQALKDNDALSDLWDRWAKATGSDGPALDRLLVALRNQRPQAREIARNMLSDKRSPATQRQYALLALAKAKNPEDDELIRNALQDSSPLDTLFSRGVVIKSQLRDVALAATIYRAGEDPKEFGFSYLKPDPATLYSPSSLGFKNDDARMQATVNWSVVAAERARDGGSAGSVER